MQKQSVFSFPPHNQITDEAEQLLGQEEDETPMREVRTPPPHVNFSIIANYHRLECFGL